MRKIGKKIGLFFLLAFFACGMIVNAFLSYAKFYITRTPIRLGWKAIIEWYDNQFAEEEKAVVEETTALSDEETADDETTALSDETQ